MFQSIKHIQKPSIHEEIKNNPECGRSIKAVKFEYLENLKILIALENDNLNTFSVHFIVSNEWNCEIRHKQSRILSIDCIIIIRHFQFDRYSQYSPQFIERKKDMLNSAHRTNWTKTLG